MTAPRTTAPALSRTEDKAERTTRAANEIMDGERRASDAKVARLKALRLGGATGAEETKTAPGASVPRKRAARAAALRTIALQDAAPAKKRR